MVKLKIWPLRETLEARWSCRAATAAARPMARQVLHGAHIRFGERTLACEPNPKAELSRRRVP